MTRRPFNPDEADLRNRDLEPTIADLERYVADSTADPTPDFADRVMHEVATQPAPRGGLWAVLAGMWDGDRGRVALLAATVAAALLAVVIIGQLPSLVPNNVGNSPQPSLSAPTAVPSPSLTESPSPMESEQPSASPTDDDRESPGASDDEDRTPRPSPSPTGSEDHSGGGGSGEDGGGNSGPGGGSSPNPEDGSGSGDNSGPGGGG